MAPGVPIARELVKRGHEVWWYTGERFRDQVSETGTRYAPMKVARDFDDRDINAAFPDRAGLHGLTFTHFRSLRTLDKKHSCLVSLVVKNSGW